VLGADSAIAHSELQDPKEHASVGGQSTGGSKASPTALQVW
jgi:hypothetical protein